MKLHERLSDKEIKKLKSVAKKKKTKKKKEEKINWHEIMGTNRPRYKRVRGAIRRK